jgi:hypothetical protein
MPTTLEAFTTDEVDVRYKEDFLTESLNTKLATVVPPGIYTGFRLSTSGLSDTIEVLGDADGVHAAVYQTGTGFSLTVRREVSPFTLTLPVTAPGRTYAICIFANYATGSTTTGELRAYEISPTDEFTISPEFDDLVVLGTVTTVSGGGVIPAADITHTRRRSAYENRAPEAVNWYPVIRNPSFIHANNPSTHFQLEARGWQLGNDPNIASEITTAQARTGTRCIEFRTINASTAGTPFVQQIPGVPVTPGQLVRVKFYYRNLAVPSAGSIDVNITWRSADKGFTVAPTAFTLDTSTVTASLDQVFDEIVEVPAGQYFLSAVFVFGSSLEYAAPGASFRIDDIQAWVEILDPSQPYPDDSRYGAQLQGAELTLAPESTTLSASGSDQGATHFRGAFLGGGLGVVIERLNQDATDPDQPIVDLKGSLSLGDSLNDTATKRATVARLTSEVTSGGASAPATADLTFLWEMPYLGGILNFRIYGGNGAGGTTGPELWFVQGASWDGTDWSLDSGTTRATAWVHLRTGWMLLEHASGDGVPWTTWANVRVNLDDDSVDLSEFAMGIGLGVGTDFDGSGDLNDLLKPRISAQHDQAGNYTLLLESKDYAGGTEPGIRIYIGEDFVGDGSNKNRALVITSNAFYNNNTGAWASDDTTLASSKLVFNRNNLTIAQRDAGAGTWFDGAGDWGQVALDFSDFGTTSNELQFGGDLGGGSQNTSRFFVALDSTPELGLKNGVLRFQNRNSSGTPIANTSSSNPTNPLYRNMLSPKQVVKAWANVSVPLGAGAPVVTEDFNVASVTRLGLLGFIVNLDDQISDTAVTGENSTCAIANVTEFGWNCHCFPDSAAPSNSVAVAIVDDTGTNQDVNNTPALDLFIIVLSEDTGV